MLKAFGILFCIGLVIQITTSVTWINFTYVIAKWPDGSDYTTGQMLFMIGQGVGELCYMFCLRHLFIERGLFLAVVEYAIGLIIIDIFTIAFLNPFEIQVSKYAGFVVAGIVLLFRLNKYGNTAGNTK